MKIEFKEDNDAFQEDSKKEIARILDIVSNGVKNGYVGCIIYDINGNEIGYWSSQE